MHVNVWLLHCGVLFPLQAGEAAQTETVSEENKSLIWTLLKQVRPGMDLSKVVLPTFILEPRSFLDKLSDYYYHADFLSEYAQTLTVQFPHLFWLMLSSKMEFISDI